MYFLKIPFLCSCRQKQRSRRMQWFQDRRLCWLMTSWLPEVRTPSYCLSLTNYQKEESDWLTCCHVIYAPKAWTLELNVCCVVLQELCTQPVSWWRSSRRRFWAAWLSSSLKIWKAWTSWNHTTSSHWSSTSRNKLVPNLLRDFVSASSFLTLPLNQFLDLNRGFLLFFLFFKCSIFISSIQRGRVLHKYFIRCKMQKNIPLYLCSHAEMTNQPCRHQHILTSSD